MNGQRKPSTIQKGDSRLTIDGHRPLLLVGKEITDFATELLAALDEEQWRRVVADSARRDYALYA